MKILKLKVQLQEINAKIFDKNINHSEKGLGKLFTKRDKLLEKLPK